MLGLFFGFRGRLGRLQYFLGNVALMVAIVLIVLLIAGLAYRSGDAKMAWVPIVLMLVVGIPTVLWISLSMQARRFRDMGWNPLIAIPAWIVVQIVDSVVAQAHPSLAIGAQHLHSAYLHTAYGAVLNILLSLALLFWPSSDSDGGYDDGGHYVARKPAARMPEIETTFQPVVTARPLARQPRKEFGRRTR